MKDNVAQSSSSRRFRRVSFYRRLEEEAFTKGNPVESMNWIQPRPQDDLDRKHNFNCEVCLIHGSSSDELLRCIYCNVICHVRCLRQFYRRAQFDPYWICFYCVDYLDDSRVVFEEEKRSQSSYHKQKRAQIYIAKHWRRFAARKQYLRIYLFVVRMQVMFHVRRRKKMFIQTLQAKLRPMKLRIMRCYGLVSATGDRHASQHRASNPSLAPLPVKSHLKPLQSHSQAATAASSNDGTATNASSRRRDSSFYILVTCMDNSKAVAVQSLRIPSRLISIDVSGHSPFDLVIEERMLLPGVSGFSVLVFSVLQRGASKDFLLGQCSLDLSAEHIWKRGGHFRLPLEEQEYVIKDHIGMDMKTDARLRPSGAIEFDLLAFNGMTSECGYCYATNADDLVRTLARLPDTRGYSVAHRSTLSGPSGPGHGAGGGGGHGSSAASGGGGGDAAPAKAMGSSDSFAIAMKKIWIAIAEGQLYVYSHFGDQLKLSLEIAAFTHHFEYREHGRILLYRLHKSGYPDFVFHTAAAQDALRWKCAFLCSARLFGREALAAKSLASSSVTGSVTAASAASLGAAAGTAAGVLDGFDMTPLLQDLWMLEALKPNSLLVREAQQVVQAQQMAQSHGSGGEAGSGGGGGGKALRRASFLAVQEAARLFAAGAGMGMGMGAAAGGGGGGGTRHSQLMRRDLTAAGTSSMGTTLRGSVLLPVLAAQRFSQPLAPTGKTPTAVSAPAAPVLAPQQQQQLFLAVGAQLMNDRVREISALDDVVTNERYQYHGERLVKCLLTSIAEKKQLLKKARSSDDDILASMSLTPFGYSRDD